MSQRFSTSCLLVASAWLLNCCGNSNSSNTTPSVDWTAGRGTAACHEWQQSFCNWASRCSLQDMTTCAAQMQQLECSSDTTAADCATSFDSAACTAMPAGCNVTDAIVNTAPAIQSCNDFQSAFCTKAVGCGAYSSAADCLTQAQSSLDCSKAVGVGLSYSTCITQVNALTCTSSDLPASCKDVILLQS